MKLLWKPSAAGPCFYLYLLLSTALLFSPSREVKAEPQGPFTFDRVESNTIYFQPLSTSAPAPVKTSLFDLSYLGALTPKEGEPYFLFTGRPCENCLEDRSIYAVRPSQPKFTAFVYPGKIFDPKSKALLLESRAFFGKCLSGPIARQMANPSGDVYVVFQKEKVDRRPKLQSSVLIAEPTQSFLSERLMERHLPRLDETLKLVRKKTCREIEGRNRLMLSKPLDLHPQRKIPTEEEENRSNELGDDDEDSEATKE